MIADEHILKSYQQGHIDSIDILVERYKNPLYKLCYRLTTNRDGADELFQDTWLKVIKSVSRYDSSKSFETWLYTICMNTYKDKYRKKKRWLNIIKDYFTEEEKEFEMNKFEGSTSLPEEELLNNELIDKLKENLNILEDSFRVPLILFYFKQMSYSDISEMLDIPIGTVKSRLNLGKKKLKELMKEEYYGY